MTIRMAAPMQRPTFAMSIPLYEVQLNWSYLKRSRPEHGQPRRHSRGQSQSTELAPSNPTYMIRPFFDLFFKAGQQILNQDYSGGRP